MGGKSITTLLLPLNLTPDRRGRIPEQDVESLMEWRKMVREAFRTDLTADAVFSASSSRGRGFAAKNMQGEDDDFWATEDGVTSGDVCLKWSEPIWPKYIVIQEHIALGQRVKEFVVEAKVAGNWTQVSEGTTIGYKRILPLKDEVTTDEIRVRFIDSRGPLTIARIAAY